MRGARLPWWWPACLASLAMAAFGAAEAAAQVVYGHVVDASTGAAIAQARVSLVAAEESVEITVLTDSSGRFRIPAPRPGTFRVHVDQFGYRTHVSDSLALADDTELEVEIALHPQPLALDTIGVTVTGHERGRAQFERRRTDNPRGIFLDPVHIALRQAPYATRILDRIPELEIDHRDRIIPRRGRCLLVFLDHVRLPVMAYGTRPSMMAFGGVAHLDQIVPARSVRGIEVYPHITAVPDEIREGFRARDVGRCAIVLVWTTIGW